MSKIIIILSCLFTIYANCMYNSKEPEKVTYSNNILSFVTEIPDLQGLITDYIGSEWIMDKTLDAGMSADYPRAGINKIKICNENIICQSINGQVRIFDLASLKCKYANTDHLYIDFCSNRYAMVDRDNQISLYDVQTNKKLHSLDVDSIILNHNPYPYGRLAAAYICAASYIFGFVSTDIRRIIFSNNKNIIAFIIRGILVLYDFDLAKKIIVDTTQNDIRYTCKGSNFDEIKFSPDNNFLLYTNRLEKDKVYIFDIKNIERFFIDISPYELYGYDQISFSPDSKYIAILLAKKVFYSDSSTFSIKIYDMKSRSIVSSFDLSKKYTDFLCFDYLDKDNIAIVKNNFCSIYNIEKKNEIQKFDVPKYEMNRRLISHDNKYLIVTSDNTLTVFANLIPALLTTSKNRIPRRSNNIQDTLCPIQ